MKRIVYGNRIKVIKGVEFLSQWLGSPITAFLRNILFALPDYQRSTACIVHFAVLKIHK